jgi:hypothetical protein
METLLDRTMHCRVGDMVLVDLPFVHAAPSGSSSRSSLTNDRVYDPRTMGVLRPRPSPFPDADAMEGAMRARQAREDLTFIQSRL